MTYIDYNISHKLLYFCLTNQWFAFDVMAAMLEVPHKGICYCSIVGSSRRGWLTLSATSQEIDCKPKIATFEKS